MSEPSDNSYPQVNFINSDAQAIFIDQYRPFVQHLPDLEKAINVAIFGAEGTVSRIDIVTIALSRIVFEDFSEIVLLCANGLSNGAMKILRGMFERAVTLSYLHITPEKVDDFCDFFAVSHRKESIKANEVVSGGLPQHILANIEAEYKAVKDRYQIENCKECKTTRDNHTWTKVDLVTMARKAQFSDIILHGYYWPMQETHSTMGAIRRRISTVSDGSKILFQYNPDPKQTEEEATLRTAHYLILRTLNVLRDRFKLENDEELKACWNRFEEIWVVTKTKE